MKHNLLKKGFAIFLAVAMVLQPIHVLPGFANTVKAAYSVADTDTIVGTFYNYGTKQVSNRENLGLYCDWTTIDGAKPLNMEANGLDKGAYLHITVELSAVQNGKHLTDFTLNNFYFKLRSVDNNGENNFGWSGITLKEGKNQLDIPLYSSASSYTGTNYAKTTKTGTMDWSQVDRLIFVSLDAKNYYGTDTDVSMTLSDVCITCPTDMRTTDAYENVRIATPSTGMSSEDMIVYTVNAVTDMGADNHGNTDATSAIQNAINSVKSLGGIVFLPAGEYKIDGTLTVPSGVTLRGEWKNPDNDGLGKGTILKAYSGAGNENATSFITMQTAACLRDLSIWYPEQNASSPVAYPYTIHGSGHTSVYNITLYNSYNGFKNNSCSSMIIRNMYGTVLHNGIWGAYAYDVPRIESVYFDTSYWAESGFSNAPSGSTRTSLNAYCETNLTAILSGEQDWGYWYDININHAKYGCYLTAVMNNDGNRVFPGNIAIADLTADNVDYGVYIHSTSYPGLELSYSNITANTAGIYYGPKPADTDYIGNEAGTVTASYNDNSSVIISKTIFQGNGYAYQGMNTNGTHSAANFNNCTFANWSDAAIYLTAGNLVCSNSTFQQNSTAVKLDSGVLQAVLSGNTFASDNAISYDSSATAMDLTTDKVVPDTPDYEYEFAPSYNPATDKIFNVEQYGALAGVTDSTSAFQSALNAAKQAGGGTVYVPVGNYTIKGSLTVPEGVELRGSYDGAHYGNGFQKGSVLYVYANKDNENGDAFITLNQNAGVRGLTIVYPEQGITDDPSVDEPVHKYPATIELNKGSWVRTCSINGAYTMLDAMTNVCDGFVINDVTGCCLGYGLLLGHGTNGGYIQDYHSNYTSWPTSFPHAYQGNVDVTEYTTQHTTWMKLGDFSNVKFFSDFSILISNGMELITDPYTGKCTQDMFGWGTAFDATGDGIIGEAGADSKVTLVNSMGVYNQHTPGYNIITKEGFTGTINLFTTDVWSPSSRLFNVAGGTVNIVQYLSWCCYNGICHDGGTLNMYGSTFIGTSSGPDLGLTYEKGASGEVMGNNNNYGNFNISVKSGATDVNVSNNGLFIDRSSDVAVEFNTYAPGTYTASSGTLTTGWKALTPLKLSSGGTQNHASLSAYNPEDLYMKLVFSVDKGNNTAADSSIFTSGNISLRQAWSKGDGTDDALCFTLNDEYFYVQSGKEITLYLPMKEAIANNAAFNWSGVKFVNITLNTGSYSGISMVVSNVEIVDSSVTDYWRYQLYQALKSGPDTEYMDLNLGADYILLANEALKLYEDETASMNDLKDMGERIEKAASDYTENYNRLRTGWIASASLNNSNAGNALDNNINTRWATNSSQENGQWFTVDFGQLYSFNTLILDVGSSKNDHPAGYEIYVSDDGDNWSFITSGTTSNGIITFAEQNKRYVKIVQTGTKSNYWSIHEFHALYTNYGLSQGVPEIVISDKLKVEGYQISYLLKGLRVISSVEPVIDGKKVVESGNIYGISSAGVTDAELVLHSNSSYVANFAFTSAGLMPQKFGSSATADYYAMTMTNNGTSADAYNMEYAVRTYAVLEDGSVVYSNIKKYTIYKVAAYLYNNNLMTNYSGHSYLFNDILKVVDSSYKEVPYNWDNMLAK